MCSIIVTFVGEILPTITTFCGRQFYYIILWEMVTTLFCGKLLHFVGWCNYICGNYYICVLYRGLPRIYQNGDFRANICNFRAKYLISVQTTTKRQTKKDKQYSGKRLQPPPPPNETRPVRMGMRFSFPYFMHKLNPERHVVTQHFYERSTLPYSDKRKQLFKMTFLVNEQNVSGMYIDISAISLCLDLCLVHIWLAMGLRSPCPARIPPFRAASARPPAEAGDFRTDSRAPRPLRFGLARSYTNLKKKNKIVSPYPVNMS